jgi:8-oxo-dGTP pyrophosphatase MutT (NUDIX family)
MESRIFTSSKKPPALPESSALQPIPVVRVFVFNEKGEILLLKRAKTSYGNNRWCLPGGKIDYFDTPEKAAKREIKEETDMNLTGLKFMFYQNSLPLAPGLMHCINLYFCALGRGVVRINEESSEFAWVLPKEAVGRKLVFGGSSAVKRLTNAENSGGLNGIRART